MGDNNIMSMLKKYLIMHIYLLLFVCIPTYQCPCKMHHHVQLYRVRWLQWAMTKAVKILGLNCCSLWRTMCTTQTGTHTLGRTRGGSPIWIQSTVKSSLPCEGQLITQSVLWSLREPGLSQPRHDHQPTLIKYLTILMNINGLLLWRQSCKIQKTCLSTFLYYQKVFGCSHRRQASTLSYT